MMFRGESGKQGEGKAFPLFAGLVEGAIIQYVLSH